MQLSTSIHHLSNGLQVLLHPDASSSKVMLQLLFQVGSKNENPHQYGYAHLCEHLYFTGTETVPNIDVELSIYGCENNAWTDIDHTCFVMSGPPETLELLLWVEQDRWYHLIDSLSEKAFQVEREVVLNELREEYENIPYGHLWLKHPSFLFTEVHPYGHPVIGDPNVLRSATRASVQEFFHQHYLPSNAILMLSGNFDPHSILDLLKQYFEDIPSRLLSTPPSPALNFTNDILHIEDQATQKILYLEWVLPAEGHPSLKAYTLLAELLTGDRYGVLYQRLELEERSVHDIDASINSHTYLSHFTIYATPIDLDLPELKASIFHELQMLYNNGIPQLLLEQVRKKMQLHWWLHLSNLWSRSEHLLYWYTIHQSFDTFHEEQALWLNIQPAEIMAVLDSLLSEPYKEIHCQPKNDV